jgi:hypothetical protein
VTGDGTGSSSVAGDDGFRAESDGITSRLAIDENGPAALR